MPIHSLGYRKWNGPLDSPASRWTVIAMIGIRRAWQSMWLRRIMFFAWVPGVVMGFLIFAYERAAEDGNPSAFMFSNMLELFVSGQTGEAIVASMSATDVGAEMHAQRHTFWCSLLLIMYQRSQAMLLIPLVGMVAPPLISQDVRSRAFLLYFSRPITRVQYILGKSASVGLFVACISVLPGLMLYLTGVLLSPDISIVLYTWDIPLRVIAVSAVMIIPTVSLALMLSSLTTESRFASFAWFSVWIFGAFAYLVISSFSEPTVGHSPLELLSLYHVIFHVQGWMLDLQNEASGDIASRIAVLVMVTIVSLTVLFKRVSAPMRV